LRTHFCVYDEALYKSTFTLPLHLPYDRRKHTKAVSVNSRSHKHKLIYSHCSADGQHVLFPGISAGEQPRRSRTSLRWDERRPSWACDSGCSSWLPTVQVFQLRH